jgi:hypothetical protein
MNTVCNNCANCENGSIQPSIIEPLMASSTVASFRLPKYEHITLDLEKIKTVADCVKLFKLFVGTAGMQSRYVNCSVLESSVPEYVDLMKDEEVDSSKISVVDNPFN